MLPKKRPAEGVLIAEEEENGSETTGSPSIKKHRIGCVLESTAHAITSATSTTINNCSVVGSNRSSGLIMAPGDANLSDIDEDLHSRQLAVYGRETMRRLFASNVLVSGMQGLGAEIAKNLILAGVKSITLHDEQTVELWDLSSNFIFSENDVGKNRALASVQKLQELNNAVVVSTLTTKLVKEKLSDFQVHPFLMNFLLVVLFQRKTFMLFWIF
uniref:THIF-type NAD/FAD binding fold domain-containing protein n=1 Tax=Manihot esculenta TaxID=3983 RepID=A0A2C9WIK8_MANES